jgi:uncharacterized Zn-binding protein involved in type VI secretion
MPSAATITHTVLSPDGSGKNCAFPMQVTIIVGNTSNVFCNTHAVVVKDNLVPPHPKSGCTPDTSVLTTYSSTVKIGGLNAGRIGDMYGNNIITKGSPNVFIGG